MVLLGVIKGVKKVDEGRCLNIWLYVLLIGCLIMVLVCYVGFVLILLYCLMLWESIIMSCLLFVFFVGFILEIG